MATLTASFVASGDVSDYTPSVRSAIAGVVAAGARVPMGAVSLRVEAASVLVTADISIASALAASTTSSLSSGILASPTALTNALVSAGVSAAAASIAPVMVLALNPPSTPPPPSLPPPATPPSTTALWPLPADSASTAGLSGSLSWGLHASACEHLLARFESESFLYFGVSFFSFVSCEELTDALLRAFSTW